MVSLAALAYYAFLFVGGIGFGYFVLRITKPDSRLMSPTQKLGASAVYGFVLFAIAFALDYFISGEQFFEATGFLPITLFFTILLTIFFLKATTMFSKPQFLVVGVPTVHAPKVELPKIELPKAKEQSKPVVTQAKGQPFKEIAAAPAVEMPKEVHMPTVKKIETPVVQTPELPKVAPKIVPTPAPAAAPVPLGPLQFEARRERKSGTGDFIEGIKHALGMSKSKVEGQEIEIAKVKEKVTPKEIAQDVLEKKVEEKPEKKEIPIIGEDEEFKKSELKKIKEIELEEIAKEISGEKGESKVEEEPVSMHRRYMEKKEAKEKEPTQEEEFDSMVQDVYNQIQLSKTRAEVSDKLKISPPPVEEKVEQKIVEQKQEQPAGLFAQEAKPMPQPAAQSSSLFEQLNVISSGKAQAPKTESDVKFVKIPANGAGCPRCHASNSRIVFCPYCGSGMCANCTPLITPKEEGFEYTCPKCGESVFVKRQTN